ncbi:hypothetical protein TRIUR3_09227 [Triticum urartu]|uniref:Uncharacterized protein n=1 Tax=Triticum urartu TaxID=4572 RepID=M7Z2G1_TRIUA|nr:hypothetical protein TRIUR3_09227 [Triticum urartu]
MTKSAQTLENVHNALAAPQTVDHSDAEESADHLDAEEPQEPQEPQEVQVKLPLDRLFLPPGASVTPGDEEVVTARVLKGSNIVLGTYARGDAQVVNADFIKSSVRPDDCPRDGLPEFALVGRSNVGKSSLLNSLVRRKRLALTSKKPEELYMDVLCHVGPHVPMTLVFTKCDKRKKKKNGGKRPEENRSADPYEDFRRSMEEMIAEWPEGDGDGEHSAESLLETYLVLNSPRHYPVILAAFADVRETLCP